MMDQWTWMQERLPDDWALVVAMDAEQNFYLVEWDAEKACFWDQGTRYLEEEMTCWMPVPVPPPASHESRTLPLAS